MSHLSGATHIVTAWELGRRGLLRIVAYDPTMGMSYEVLLTKTERVCLGCEGEDCKLWSKHLIRRLSFRRASSENISMKGQLDECDNPPPARRTMILDKTVFSTACRVAARGTDSRLLRVRASLVDAGKSLALDLFAEDASKQCRFLLSADNLVEGGLSRRSVSPESCRQVVPVRTDLTLRKQSRGMDVDDECAYARDLMAQVLASADSREDTVRRLVRQLHFGDADNISLFLNGAARSCVMTPPGNIELRRPKNGFRRFYRRRLGRTIEEISGGCGFDRYFLNRRRQPEVLIYGKGGAQKTQMDGVAANFRWACR